MPQMSPLKWLSLFTFFISMFLLFSLISYYSFSYSYPSKSLSHSYSSRQLLWKW